MGNIKNRRDIRWRGWDIRLWKWDSRGSHRVIDYRKIGAWRTFHLSHFHLAIAKGRIN
jgi:hypothetical protein